MRYLYNFITYLTLPFIFLRLLFKSIQYPNYRKRINERFGYYKIKPLNKSIWIHAVSVGETIAAIPLVKALHRAYPNTPIVFTTMTPTGSVRVQKNLGELVTHVYAPYDYPQAVTKFLNHFKPKLAIIMETELWPNILHLCSARKTPIMLANARLSQKSTQRYKHLGKFIKIMLNNISIIATQSSIDAKNFKDLGAKNTVTTGNIKFDLMLPDDLPEHAHNLRQKWGQNRPLWIAASTHKGEEEIILAAHKTVLEIIPNALLLLVPRHPQRFSEVKELCINSGFKTISRSSNENCSNDTNIIIGDTMGELLLFYTTADVAFVGGSLITSVGGHNLLEPAATKTPIVTGAHLFNFIEVSQLLKSAVIKARDASQLSTTIINFLLDKELSEQYANTAYQVVMQNRGATKRLLLLVRELLAK